MSTLTALTRLLPGLLAAAALLPAAALERAEPSAVGLSPERLVRLDHAFQSLVADGTTAGAVVLVARHGRVAHLNAYGYADIGAGRAMTGDAMFRLYSMTKPVTSVALLMLYEQGHFQLTDPLAQHLPEFADVRVHVDGDDGDGDRVAPERPITVQDVFRHTAGFTYGVFGNSAVDRAYMEAGVSYAEAPSLAAMIDALAEQPLLYQPGERWVYSVAHNVQARLVEVFSGMPFAQYVRERILDPLGMDDTVWGVPDSHAGRFAGVYQADGEGELQPVDELLGSDYRRFTDTAFGGVGLSATVGDYLRFAQMLLNGGELDGVRLLGPRTVELMTRDHLHGVTADGTAASPGPGTGYGLGVSVLRDPAAAGNLGSAGQFGWAGAATTWVTMDPEEGLVAMVFAQNWPYDGAMINRFQTLVYQALVD